MDTDDKATPADEDRVDYLIARGQAFRGEPDQYAELITELANVLEAERDRADRVEAALSRLLDAHDVHVEMDKAFEYECPQCRHEATA